MPNSTLVSVPAKFDDLKQLRVFVVKLIEKLDIVLGYRGSAGYETAGTAESLTTITLNTLNEAISEVEQTIDSLTAIIEDLSEVTYKSETAIIDLSYTAPTISATYSQAEVQGIADDVATVADKVDELLAALRTVEIID